MRQPNSIDEFIHRDEQMDRIDRNLPILEPITRKVADIHIPEWGCRCVQTDVDQWDARGCPEHGATTHEAEIAALENAAYYAVDPFEEKEYDRYRLTPTGELKPVRKPAGVRETPRKEASFGH